LAHNALQHDRKTINKIISRLKLTIKDTRTKAKVAAKVAQIEETWEQWTEKVTHLFQTDIEVQADSSPVHALLKGFIHEKIQFPIIEGITKGTRTEIHGKLLNRLYDELIEHRWQPRCKTFQDWAKSTITTDGNTVHTLGNRLKSSLKRTSKKSATRKRSQQDCTASTTKKRRLNNDTQIRTNISSNEPITPENLHQTPPEPPKQVNTTTPPAKISRTSISPLCLKLYSAHLRLRTSLSPIITPHTALHYGLRTMDAIRKYSKLRDKAHRSTLHRTTQM